MQSKDETGSIPVIGLDYVFFTDSKKNKEKEKQDEAEPTVTPNLCFKDKGTKTIHADVVACKCVQDVKAVEATVAYILRLGYPEVILCVDNEPTAKVFPVARFLYFF